MQVRGLRGAPGLPRTREVPPAGKRAKEAKSEVPLEPGTSFFASFHFVSHDLLPLAVCLGNTCPLLTGSPSLSLGLAPLSGSGPSICGGVFSLSGCLPCSHLGTPAHLLSSPVSPAESHRSLLYHFTAVSAPASGTPAFWVSGWLGPQQYLSYNNLRAEAEPYGAWVWESQVSWYWEKETTDLRNKEKLFLEALQVLGEGGETGTPESEDGWCWGLDPGFEGRGAGGLDPGSEGGGDQGPCSWALLICVWASQVPTPCRACWAASWALTMSRCLWPSLP